MENKSAFTPEEEAVLEDVRKRGGFEALSAEDLGRITGGGSLGIKGIFDVDMSVYSPVYFSLEWLSRTKPEAIHGNRRSRLSMISIWIIITSG